MPGRSNGLTLTAKQAFETLGHEPEWNRSRAKAELRAREVDVQREGLRKPTKTTFASFADDFLDTYPKQRELKTSTEQGYRQIVAKHLKPSLGNLSLDRLTVARIDHYIAAKRDGGLAARTVNRHLNLLSKILTVAVRRGLLKANPVAHVDRPKERGRHWRILTPVEAKQVGQAFHELAAEADSEAEREWREQCRVVFLTILGTWLRRGEIQGLRWRSVHLTDPEGPWLRVEETWVRSERSTPKSEAGERSVPIGPVVEAELNAHLFRSHYSDPDDLVFPHPQKGTPFDPARYGDTFKVALRRAGIEDYVRPFHDGRHSGITNAAAAGSTPLGLMARAGHSNFQTTQGYIDLAGQMFRAEADQAEARMLGVTEKEDDLA